MKETIMHVHFIPVGQGWLTIQLDASDPQQSFTFIASHTPYDSLYELAVHLIMVAYANEGQSFARWNTEPTEYEMRFSTKDDWAEVILVSYPSHTRDPAHQVEHFSYRTTRSHLVTTFWRALRTLESNHAFQAVWQHPFPVTELQRITTYVHASK
jgi:hypothetical protein